MTAPREPRDIGNMPVGGPNEARVCQQCGNTFYVPPASSVGVCSFCAGAMATLEMPPQTEDAPREPVGRVGLEAIERRVKAAREYPANVYLRSQIIFRDIPALVAEVRALREGIGTVLPSLKHGGPLTRQDAVAALEALATEPKP